jgi:L-rhamnose mutarotase
MAETKVNLDKQKAKLADLAANNKDKKWWDKLEPKQRGQIRVVAKSMARAIWAALPASHAN